MRQAMQDDVIPLSDPVRIADGGFTDRICIQEGTVILVPFAALNCSISMWGPDAKMFKPSRWLAENQGTQEAKAEALHGYRHLMTFGDGARMCLGRLFALTEFKVWLEEDICLSQFVNWLWSLSRLCYSSLCETSCSR
jgi:hypothetical protein